MLKKGIIECFYVIYGCTRSTYYFKGWKGSLHVDVVRNMLKTNRSNCDSSSLKGIACEQHPVPSLFPFRRGGQVARDVTIHSMSTVITGMI